MKSIVITGCNRGLGLGLVRQFVLRPNPPKYIIATCRNLDKAEELKKTAGEHKNVHILHLDVTNYEKFDGFSQEVSQIVKDDGLNVLFNNVGISPKFSRINLVKADQLLDTYATNTVAPILLTKALLPVLRIAAAKNSNKPMGIQKAAIINMSSILGSIANNTGGGYYPYNCSKAALNMATKSMSIDLFKDGILATSLHPGWVKTELGGSKAPLEIEDSTYSIVQLLDKLNESHNGGLYQWDGKQLEF